MEKIDKINYQTSFGIYGAPTVINTTNATPVKAVALQAMSTNVVIASITINGTAITDLSGITLAQGMIIYGLITSVTLTSGVAFAYAGEGL